MSYAGAVDNGRLCYKSRLRSCKRPMSKLQMTITGATNGHRWCYKRVIV
jgi:hypothetical protein